jgi:hypothetical protein
LIPFQTSSYDIARIDKLLNSFKDETKAFGKTIWWHNGSRNFYITLEQKSIGVWKFLDYSLNNYEYKIKEIWLHYNDSHFNDFILVHYTAQEPFIIDGKKKFNAAIVDDKYYISDSEYGNGFAEIEGNIVELSKHKVEYIVREKERGFFFICNEFHCVFDYRNDEAVRECISHIENAPVIDIEVLKNFADDVRVNKHPSVLMQL